MFSNAKVGDRVWDFTLGKGTIIKIDRNITNPIRVKFDRSGYIFRFKFNGKLNENDINPTLFWDEIKYEIPKKPFDLKAEFEKLEVVEFEPNERNKFIYYDYDLNTWDFTFDNKFSTLTTLYFKESNEAELYKFVDLLNEHKITPEQLRPLMINKLREVYGE